MMNIVIATPWVSYRGGDSIPVIQSYWLKKAGCNTKIVSSYLDEGRLPEEFINLDYVLPPKIISSLAKKNRMFVLVFSPIFLWLLLRNLKDCDFIVAHNPPFNWFAGFLRNFIKKPSVWVAHSVPKKVSWKDKRGVSDYLISNLMNSPIDKYLVRRFDLTIAVSDKVKSQVRKRYARKAYVVHNGVNITKGKISDLPQKVKDLRNKSNLLLLQVGNLHTQKRQATTIKACAKLISQGKKVGLILVGEGPDRKLLERQIEELGIKDWVIFSGYVHQDLLGALYKVSDLYVLPSVRESFSATPLEAMYHETISIVSQGSGVLEVLKRYAISVKPNSEDLVKKIKLFGKDRNKYKRQARQGKSYLVKGLSWKDYESRFIRVVNKELLDMEVSRKVYSRGYFKIHHEIANEELERERETRLMRAIQFLQVEKGDKILDLGCGNGELSIRLARKGAEVCGVDYSKQAISLARSRLTKVSKNVSKKVNYSFMDAKKLNFESNYFDKIVCLDVFEHIYPNTLKKVIKQMKRVIKPGGMIVVETAPNAYLHRPVSFISKRFLGKEKYESDEYHINIMNYFSFKEVLKGLSSNVWVNLYNDGHKSFSSRLESAKDIPGWVKSIAGFFDFLRENPISEKVILSTPLKIILAYDLWAVVKMNNKDE